MDDTASPVSTFQPRVARWVHQCFGPAVAGDMQERGDRLLEEVLEYLQAHGYDPGRVPALTRYVFGRPVGEPVQELGGVMVTLAAHAEAAGLDMAAAGLVELERIEQPEIVEVIRNKQAPRAGVVGPLPTQAAVGNQAGVAELLSELRRSYTRDPVPPCRICGGPLSVQSIGGGQPTVWACSGKEDDPDRPNYIQTKAGRWEKAEPGSPSEYERGGHFHDSHWTAYRSGDSRVLALIDLYEQTTGEVLSAAAIERAA